MLLEGFKNLKVEDATWATTDTFSTRQTTRVDYMLAQPGMAAHINSNWAVERADATLDAASAGWNDVAFGKHFPA